MLHDEETNAYTQGKYSKSQEPPMEFSLQVTIDTKRTSHTINAHEDIFC